jgi:TPR repeat protein
MQNSPFHRSVILARERARHFVSLRRFLMLVVTAAGAAMATLPAAPANAGTFVAKLASYSMLIYAQARRAVGPLINIGTLILVEPASETAFPIQVALGDGVPKNSFIRIRGLPPSTALSEGHSIAAGAWAVPFVGLPTLRINVPVGLSGRSEIHVALVTIDGAVLAEAKTTLVIAPAATVGSAQPETRTQSVASIGPTTSARPESGGSSVPKSTTPVAPQRTEEQQRALRFVTKGHELLTEGDVATARLYYQRAVDAGLHEGALAMAASYDPIELNRVGVQGLQPNLQLARTWYERARQLGAPDAEERLRRLTAR